VVVPNISPACTTTKWLVHSTTVYYSVSRLLVQTIMSVDVCCGHGQLIQI